MLDASPIGKNETLEPDELLLCERLDESWFYWPQLSERIKTDAKDQLDFSILSLTSQYPTYTGDPEFHIWGKLYLVGGCEKSPQIAWWKRYTTNFRFWYPHIKWHLNDYTVKGSTHWLVFLMTHSPEKCRQLIAEPYIPLPLI